MTSLGRIIAKGCMASTCSDWLRIFDQYQTRFWSISPGLRSGSTLNWQIVGWSWKMIGWCKMIPSERCCRRLSVRQAGQTKWMTSNRGLIRALKRAGWRKIYWVKSRVYSESIKVFHQLSKPPEWLAMRLRVLCEALRNQWARRKGQDRRREALGQEAQWKPKIKNKNR